ncbi:unnamed protein product, partial [Phaeothamnion confervicola]
MTGHASIVVDDARMVVIGGGNKRQFHSCRHVMVYDSREDTWGRHAACGDAPVTLIYHTVVAVDRRRLVVYGGSVQGAQEGIDPLLWVFDTLTMSW